MKQQDPTNFRARLASAEPSADGDLSWLPAWRIRELVAARALSPVEVVDHFLGRIAELDPRLHAFRMVDADGARSQAKQAEAALLRGEEAGPLCGIPVATKSVLAIKGLPWTDMGVDVGIAAHDAMEVERLRAAGAIIVGPTVAGLTAWEFGDSDRAPLNPWDTERVCGDSSCGSACATASAMVPIAIGGDGFGSTRAPAAFCGLIGLRPTRGRVPSFEWGTLQTRPMTSYGPMARDVRDAALVMAALAGPDGRDLMCLQSDPPDYLEGIGQGVAGLRLAWSDDFGFGSRYAVAETPRVIEAVRNMALRLETLGAHVEAVDMAVEDPFPASNKWVASDAAISSDYDLGLKPPTRDEIVAARDSRNRIWSAFREVTDGHDFILSPTTLEIAPTRRQWAIDGIPPDFAGTYLCLTAFANLIGWPAISVPAGMVDGMPVGMQIMGRPDSEPGLFRLAQAVLSLQD
ncbi:MAG TPA: amidase [Sphingobium sp.]|nr:amidase [Sphingobium sp.]